MMIWRAIIKKFNLERLTMFSLFWIMNVIVWIAILSIYHDVNPQKAKIVKADLTLIAKNYINRELLKVHHGKEEDLKPEYLRFMKSAKRTIEQLAKENGWIVLLHESTLGGVIDVTAYVEEAIIKNL